MEIKGTITEIFDTVTVSEKFKKREFVVKTEGEYPQEVILQMVQDKTTVLDKYNVGELVTCDINIKGRRFVKTGQDDRFFVTLEAWKINKDENKF